jgi:hypothetical protein
VGIHERPPCPELEIIELLPSVLPHGGSLPGEYLLAYASFCT